MSDSFELLRIKDSETLTNNSRPSTSRDMAHSERTHSGGSLGPHGGNPFADGKNPEGGSYQQSQSQRQQQQQQQQQQPQQHQSQDAQKGQSSPAAATAAKPPEHPRKDMPAWKWRGTIAVVYLTSVISGYDVSNVANIQPRLYEAFGDIKLLPWIGLSYSLAFFAVMSLSRKIILCFNLRWVLIFNLLIFMTGAAVAGAAPNFPTVIIGRVIMGIGGCHVQTTDMSFLAVLATPAETPGLFAGMSASWAIGLVIGGPVGSALAANSSTTWRWAFYMNLPWTGLAFILAFFCLPRRSFAPPISLMQRLTKIDPLGIVLNIASPVLFGLALTFSGPIWSWNSGPAIAVWVVFAIVTVFWAVQQWFCILTTPTQRALPVHILPRPDLIPIWIASGCAGVTYAVTLYYTPLFFAFARGLSAIPQTVRLLPFILVFIIIVMMTGRVLPLIGRYNLIYIVGGVLTLAGGAAMAATMSSSVSGAQVMGLEALIGIGLGMHFQHGVGISNVINKDPRARLDSVVICNMAQMGAIAIILAVAGSIFQNVGYHLLVEALGKGNYSDNEIREALAGVSSVVWQTNDPEVLHRAVSAVADVIGREFYLVVASGATCLACGLLMKWEKLDYGKGKKPVKKESRNDSGESA